METFFFTSYYDKIQSLLALFPDKNKDIPSKNKYSQQHLATAKRRTKGKVIYSPPTSV